jgi:diguanylate cyclase (GGDEF)-like protein
MNFDAVRRLIKSVGLILAIAIGVAIPVAFGILHFLDLRHDAQSEAEFHAGYLGRLTETGLIAFSPEGLQGAIAAVAATSSTQARIRVLGDNNASLLEWGPKPPSGYIAAAAPITLGGEPIGRVEVQKSLAGAALTIGGLAVLALVLALVVYLAMSSLPAQALDEASAEIASHRERLEEKNAHLDAALENMVQGLCLYDADQRVIVANRRYAEIYQLPLELIKPGTTLRQVLEARVRNGTYVEQEARDVVDQGIAKFEDYICEVATLRDGRHISVVRRPLAGGGLISTHEDITDRKRADAIIAHMAMHDGLTGLPNRSMLLDRLQKSLPRTSSVNMLAVHCIDLDRFKAVNDTLGHPMGDALLTAVGERLQTCVRGNDVVARLGGDEFAVLQCGLSEPHQAAALAERLIAELSEPFLINGHRISVGASVGIGIAPSDGEDSTSLLKNADLALYCSKAEGRGRYRFFERDMDARIQARRLLELDLQSALPLAQFELHYQPLVDLATDKIVAMEALLRWTHPTRGKVPPSEFIPIVEEIGLIGEIGRWVIDRACQEAATWPSDIGVSVNLSPHQFKTGSLALDVAAALGRSGLPAHRLELEITESALMQNTQATLDTLKAIRALGVKVAMDDFGTGYSSLSYLHAFPFDKIKIDKCFVQSLSEKPESAHILKAVVDLGANLRMVTTAEGVETQAQLDRLREDGCTQVQGYFFSPPRPAGEVPDMLRRMEAPMAKAS